MESTSIPSPVYKKQSVVLGDKVLSVLKSPNGVVISQWRLEEIIDIAFFPAQRKIGGKKAGLPFGEIRIARTFAERRMGYDWSSNLGIAFRLESEQEAFKLFQALKAHPQIQLHSPVHLAQVETEKFVLTLGERDLTITRREYYTGFKQTIDTVLINAGWEGETKIDLSSITGVNLRPAHNDKISFGSLSGKLEIITPRDVGAHQILGTRFQGALELDFSKSSEAKIMIFITEMDAQREKMRALTQDNVGVQGTKYLADELKVLAELRDSGILTEGEFKEAKAKLLGS